MTSPAYNFKNIFPLLCVLALALFLRLYAVSSFPALNADEAAIGYNAYSLLETGKDEHGHPYPIEFQSFNDYKPGAYFYLTLPFVKLLGLTVLAVRLPNIILSVLAVYLIYLLGNHLFPALKTKLGIWNLEFGIFPSLLLAISPWHLHFSRGGWEVSAGTSFLLLSVYLFVKSSEKRYLLPLSLVSLVISLYTYHAIRLLAPALFIILAVSGRKRLLRNPKLTIVSLVVSLFLLLPLVATFVNQTAAARFAGVGLLADRGPLSRAEELRSQHPSPASVFTRMYHNRYFEYFIRLIDNYIRHFQPVFLFLSGDDIERNKVPSQGLLYLFEIVTLPLGLFFVLKNRFPGKFILLGWLILGPVAAAMTFQSPHALRSQNLTIPLSLISGLGLYLVSRHLSKFTKYIFMLFMIWNFAYYLEAYYVHLVKTYPYSSQYAFPQLVDYIKENYSGLETIYITDRYDQPYILTLFYLRFSPAAFQGDHRLTPRDAYGFSTVERFDKFEFGKIKWENITRNGKNLIVLSPEESPPSITPTKTILFPGNQVAFNLYIL